MCAKGSRNRFRWIQSHPSELLQRAGGAQVLSRIARREGRRGAFSLILAGLSLGSSIAPAHAEGGVDWSFKAFGTLGAIGTDTHRIGFRRDFTQNNAATSDWGWATDSRLGLQLDADFNREWHAAVQFVARNHAGNFLEQNLEWAYLRWRPRDDLDVRVGRLGADAFLLSDYRNVGYAYPWMRPPNEHYAPLLPYHFDGADVAWRLGLGEGYLTIKGYTGYNLTQIQPSNSPVVDLEMFAFGGNLLYEHGDWRARLGYVQVQPLADPLKNTYLGQINAALSNPLTQVAWPEAQSIVNRFAIQGRQLHYGSMGLAYDDGVWLAQAEAAYIPTDIQLLPTLASGYLSVGRRFGPVTAYTLLGMVESMTRHVRLPDPALPVPALLEAKTDIEDAINGIAADEKSVSLGLRWDVYDNIALKAQWTHHWLGHKNHLFWLDPDSPTPAEVNVWSFGLDFVY